MKTLKIQFATLSVLVAFFTLNLNANPTVPNFSEEMYINDIPFNTEKIVENYSIIEISREFDLLEEDEIFDIPFNTAYFTTDSSYELDMAVEFEMEDEDYINDIPFSTEKVSSVVIRIDFKDEAYIDDIPFSTSTVVSQIDCSSYLMK